MLAWFCETRKDRRRFTSRPSNQHVEIERVKRFTYLEHHIIGGIDDVVDRAHPDQPKATLDPVGAGTYFHPFDQAQYKARIKLWMMNLEPYSPLKGWTAPRHLVRWLLQLGICKSCDLARNS